MIRMGMRDLFDPAALYPDIPGVVRGSDTSTAAGKSMEPIAGALRQQVYAKIKQLGNATCDEIEELLGMAHQTASARIRELCLTGHIRDTGARRKTRSGRPARVYEVTTP